MLRNFPVLVWLLFSLVSYSQEESFDFSKAEEWTRDQTSQKVFNAYVTPFWSQNNNGFTYKVLTKKGIRHYYVDLKTHKKSLAFNHQILTDKLSVRHNAKYNPGNLNLKDAAVLNDSLIEFSFKDTLYVYNKSSNSLSLKEQPVKHSNEMHSPDGKYKAYFKAYNLFITNEQTNKTRQLTTDGEYLYDYAAAVSWDYIRNESIESIEEQFFTGYWSDDSEWLIVPRYDRRNTSKLYLYNASPDSGNKAEVYSYIRPLAGDSLITRIEYIAFNAKTGKRVKLDFQPDASYWEYGINWLQDGKKVWSINYTRGFKSTELVELNVKSGKKRQVLKEEASNSYVDPLLHQCHFLEDRDEFIWSSEKDGWNHLYRYKYSNERLINQVTKGNYVVKSIEYIDTAQQTIYFMACGMSEDEDPYYTHLYSVKFDGSDLSNLTPENAFHEVTFSSDGNYFIDNFSNSVTPNTAVLYNRREPQEKFLLEKEDITSLEESGWQAPEPFEVTGRDGKTPIYGLIYRPFDFDSTKKYPVIDASYSGPQSIRTPKNFAGALQNDEIALAQLGFVVITVDGFGTAYRSKKFHDYSYRNLGDIGAADHIKAIKALAEKYPSLDTTRVGIYGHSAGGYDAVRALLMHPDFYKIAVSSAGNHDHRMSKAWWPELYKGYPLGKHYDEQSNLTHAAKLQGKLLLVHGAMDQNVNPASTLRLSDRLIDADKDFEIILLENNDHNSTFYNSYFIQKRWEFFVRYLLETE